jgi:hypothetical protein
MLGDSNQAFVIAADASKLNHCCGVLRKRADLGLTRPGRDEQDARHSLQGIEEETMKYVPTLFIALAVTIVASTTAFAAQGPGVTAGSAGPVARALAGSIVAGLAAIPLVGLLRFFFGRGPLP